MARYKVCVQITEEVVREQNWLIEADSPEEAREKALDEEGEIMNEDINDVNCVLSRVEDIEEV